MLYRKYFDGRSIYFINIETGQRKSELGAGDICVGDQFM